MVSLVTPNLIEKCDRLADACDTLLDGCESADENLDRVTQLARQLELETLHLYEAQARLELERQAFSRMLFWAELTPHAIRARLTRTFSSKPRP